VVTNFVAVLSGAIAPLADVVTFITRVIA